MASSLPVQQDNTYEATRARQSTYAQPDKITWSESSAYRQNPYRLLHHQKGLMGKFRVQLLEARDLKRSYWSALALGPVKHLGLSKAHGPISSYASFGLAFPQVVDHNSLDQKPRAVSKTPGWTPSSEQVVQSPVVPENDNPVWQSCEFDLPLKKGIMRDGQRILLQVRMDEDATAAEAMIPVGVPSPDERLLGTGSLDITSLCLGETSEGSVQVGVMDTWIPLELQKKEPDHDEQLLLEKAAMMEPEKELQNENESSPTGRVRVLVSYTPHGLDPRHNDWVAMEAFARRSLVHNQVTPLVPPLSPMRVMDIRGPYLLVEYSLKQKKAMMRLHRNAVFVMERTNVVDGVVNLALAPTDLFLGTRVGRSTARLAAPVVSALGELVQPAVLTTKIFINVIKTTALAGFSGITAATGAAVAAAQDANERRQQQASFHASNNKREERFV